MQGRGSPGGQGWTGPPGQFGYTGQTGSLRVCLLPYINNFVKKLNCLCSMLLFSNGDTENAALECEKLIFYSLSTHCRRQDDSRQSTVFSC